MRYPTATAAFAAAFVALQILLTAWVIAGRVRSGINHGDGGHDWLNRRIRAHGNLVEIAPPALILAALSEARGAPQTAVAGVLGVLFVARLIHPIGMLAKPGSTAQYVLRGAPMVTTLACLVFEAALLVRTLLAH